MKRRFFDSLLRENVVAWAMVGPAALLIAGFLILPFFLAFGLSFTNARLVSPHPPEIIGLANYQELFGIGLLVREPERDEAGSLIYDANGALSYPRLREFTRNNPDYPHLQGKREFFAWTWQDKRISVLTSDVIFLKALINTFAFVLFAAPIQTALALVLAILINQKLKGISLFRAIYFMPVVISLVVVSLLWRFIYDSQDGLLNNLLNWISFGLFQPVSWLGDPKLALGAIIAMSIWQGVGFHMIIWLAGLQSIPEVLYEAAEMDGARRWEKFRDVTWPGLRNTAVLIVIVITMQAFSVYAQINVMTGGGPLDSTQTLVFQAVQRGYGQQNIGGGSAIAVVLFIIVLCISLLQGYLTRERSK